MLKIGGLLIFALSLVFFTNAHAAEITKSDVRNLLSKMDVSVQKKDAQGVTDLMSDDVEIILNFDIQGQKQILEFTKIEYLEALKQGWAKSSDYSYDWSDLVIDIQNDQALVSATGNETVTIQGQTISSTFKQEILIEKVNGELLTTKVISYGKIKTPNNQLHRFRSLRSLSCELGRYETECS